MSIPSATLPPAAKETVPARAGIPASIAAGIAAALLAIVPPAHAGSPAGSAVMGAAPAPPRSIHLTRAPWIALVQETSVLVAWQTDSPGLGLVRYAAPGSGALKVVENNSRIDHTVSLVGLSPGTRYVYDVETDGAALTGDLEFGTAPLRGASFRFVAFGDCGTGSVEQRAVAAQMDALRPDLGIVTGDIVYPNGDWAYYTPRYFDIYAPTIARCAFYPALGNHDVETDSGAPFLQNFYLPANNPQGTERYYSFDYADAHFVCLDTNQSTAPGSPQAAWLADDLQATRQHWKFVYLHFPLYCADPQFGSNLTVRANLEPIFVTFGVDVVFAGHAHVYERTYPISMGASKNAGMDPNYTDPGAPIYVVTGGGGSGLTSGGSSWFTAAAQTTYHFTDVVVGPYRLDLRAIRQDGVVFDQMSIVKTPPTDLVARPGGALSLRVSPNPLRLQGQVLLEMAATARVHAYLVDVAGRLRTEVADGVFPAGTSRIPYRAVDDSGRPLPAGHYFLRLDSPAGGAATRVVIVP